MNFWLNLPLDARYLVLALIGALLGSVVNFGVAAFSLSEDKISPWLKPRWEAARPRRLISRVPIVGWISLWPESIRSGRWFWFRAVLVEVAMAVAVPALYWWEVVEKKLWMAFPGLPPGFLPLGFLPTEELEWAAHAMFCCHLLLGVAMATASLIDFDEKNIPDAVTVPTTLLGLITAAIFPWSRLPSGLAFDGGVRVLDFMKVTSPMRLAWPETLGESPSIAGLAIGVGCFVLWIVALLPRPWRTFRGYRAALKLCAKHFWPALKAWDTLTIIGIGTVGILATWLFGGPNWVALSTSLVGMFVGGGMVWIVRVLGSTMLRKEAMGMGDVTLMAMIGTFLGWQTCLLVFFLAPMVALVFSVIQLVLTKNGEIYYGPFLCFAAGLIVLQWPAVWGWAWLIFDLGWLVPAAMAVALVAMIVLLGIMQWTRSLFRRN